MPKEEKLYLLADELRVIANEGLTFSNNEYDTARYQKVLEASARLYSSLNDTSTNTVLNKYKDHLTHLSPLFGAEAVVFQDNKILLIQRSDDKRWAIPGGLVNVGETSAEAAQRELWEELNVHGSPIRMLGIFDSRLWDSFARFHLYHIVFEFEINSGQPQTTLEAIDFGFFSKEELPPLYRGHDIRVPMIFKLIQGESQIPFFDPPNQHEQINE